MAKKQTTPDRLITYYMDFVLENGKKPTSVYAFTKLHNLKEEDFYKFYASLEVLEKEIFKAFFDNTFLLLDKNEEYHTYNPKNKLLSFYFSFFELLTANRSYVVQILKGKESNLKSLSVLQHLRTAFIAYIKQLQIEIPKIENKSVSKFQNKSFEEAAWIQLLLTLKFWLDDTSPSFEKTDIFIEKSLQAGFDLIDIKPFQNILDFGKFIIKERTNFTV